MIDTLRVLTELRELVALLTDLAQFARTMSLLIVAMAALQTLLLGWTAWRLTFTERR